MKVVFVGELEPAGWVSTTRGRMNALASLGHELIGVDLCRYVYHGPSRGNLVGRLWRKLALGPPIIAFNRAILRAVAGLRPDLLYVEKGIYVWPHTIRQAKRICGCQAVHYTPDPAFYGHCTRHFVRSVPEYDLMVTNKAYELERYRTAGAKRVVKVLPTVDLQVHRPPHPSAEELETFRADVGFVGTYVAGREELLGLLGRQLDIDFVVWGNRWDKCPDAALRARARLRGVGGREYSLAQHVPAIALNPFNSRYPDRINSRVIEIPANGGFMLCQRTDEATSVFREGVHAAFFGTAEELVEKVRYYLTHEDERRSIAEAGHRLVTSGGFSSVDRMREVLAALDET